MAAFARTSRKTSRSARLLILGLTLAIAVLVMSAG